MEAGPSSLTPRKRVVGLNHSSTANILPPRAGLLFASGARQGRWQARARAAASVDSNSSIADRKRRRAPSQSAPSPEARREALGMSSSSSAEQSKQRDVSKNAKPPSRQRRTEAPRPQKNPRRSHLWCEECQKGFTRPADLQRHLNTVAAHCNRGKSVHCPMDGCVRGYTREDALRRHMKDAHPEELDHVPSKRRLR
ncbi:hypothetical protein AcW1_003654 [Taiwanofungus camphoratus]|nr:hypothetical protein AcV5_007343 [Antrodia cinnamomea]KAI0940466.1 hypothetical protein AcW1_003654 [Antrodia cinnamomea]KAI0958364.1 hypothetical protein AcV7_004201 [Antrodia cinnamomea]